MDIIKGKSTTILCILTASNVPFSGTITAPHIFLSKDGGTATDIVATSTLTYDADLEGWQFTPPIQTSGDTYSCTIKGSNTDNYYLNGKISSGGGMGTVITYSAFDPDAGTIDTGNTSLTKIQIIDIYNMDKHLPLFRTTEERTGKIVSVVDGVITLENPVYLGKCSSGDDLQIMVNQG